MTKKQALKKACQIAGGKSALARSCNVKRQAVQQWFTNGVSAKRAIQIEKATGVSRADLRPDLFK